MAGFAGRLSFLLLLTVLLSSLRNEAEARESKFFTSEALELVIPSSPSDSPAQAPESEALAPESEAPAPVSGSDDSYGNGYGLYGHETSEFPTTTTTTTTTTTPTPTIADEENQIQAEELSQQGFQEREKGYPYNSNNNGYYDRKNYNNQNGYYYNNKNGGFYNNNYKKNGDFYNNNYNENGGYVGGGREGKYYYGNGNSEDSYGNSGNSYEFDSMEEYERQQSQGGYFP